MQFMVDGDGIKVLSTRAIIDLLKNPFSSLSLFVSEIILKLLSTLETENSLNYLLFFIS